MLSEESLVAAPKPEIVLTLKQEAAVDLACHSRLACITGGPGTGKTTLIKAAVMALRDANESVSLCAPTGKAAKRMSQATGFRASTIHRLLGVQPGMMFPKLIVDAPDVIIADEASMIDTELMAVLMESCRMSRVRLVLVGDADQLPSVGPGMVFRELLSVPAVPKVILTEVHRAAQESWIGRNAPRIRDGEMPELNDGSDFRFRRADNVSNVIRILTEVYSAIEPENEPLLLTPQNKGPLGTTALNNLIQAQYNPPVSHRAWDFKQEYMIDINDPVLQTRNDYDLNVFNGEVGDVVDVTKSELVVSFGDDRYVTYKKRDAWNLKLAYALTVHKSQGSQSPCVIFIAHPLHTFMLSRSLFYTAVTRSEKEVAIIGTEGAVAGALNKISDAKRNTLLSTRIADAQQTLKKEYEVLP